jgi:hypothetical protein
MFTLMPGLPPDVLGVEASGKVTHEDYQRCLIPRAEAMMLKGPIKMIYVLAQEFAGYELGALWDDTAFGIRHWRHFSHVAIVGDQNWLRAAVSLFKPVLPCEVRLFGLAELQTAKDWITHPEGTASPRLS